MYWRLIYRYIYLPNYPYKMKINKNILLAPSAILAGLALPFSAVQASPLVSIGDQVDVFFTGTSSVSWQSNLFRSDTNEVEDFLLTLSPGFEFDFGRGLSNADFRITTRYDILSYDKSDDWNTETLHIKALGSYQASRLTVNGTVSFDETQTTLQDNVTVGSLVESEITAVNVKGEYVVSPKFSVGSGVSYSDRVYTTQEASYADRESYSIPVDVFYELTPKVDLSLGYQYTTRDVESVTLPSFKSAYETESHFFNIGARGDLLPKLVGSVKVGYRQQDTDYSDATADTDDSGLGIDTSLVWAASPKLAHTLLIARDFGSSGAGARIEESSINYKASYSIDSQWGASANLGYSLREYLDDANDREDVYVSAGLRLNYSPNQYWSFGGGYTYMENDSDLAANSYENHKLDVSASLRY